MTLIPFTPSATGTPFTAQMTLDGASYTFAARWNLYRGDWYFSLSDANGNLVVNAPLIGSPPSANVNLVPGLFTTSTIAYRPSTGNIEVTP